MSHKIFVKRMEERENGKYVAIAYELSFVHLSRQFLPTGKTLSRLGLISVKGIDGYPKIEELDDFALQDLYDWAQDWLDDEGHTQAMQVVILDSNSKIAFKSKTP
jgi:hypothetical protein